MLKQKAEEWAKELRLEIECRKKEITSLGKEMEKLNFKIGALQKVQEEKWSEMLDVHYNVIKINNDDVVLICSNEIRRLERERDERNEAMSNLEAEIEYRGRIIETLKESPYRIEEN